MLFGEYSLICNSMGLVVPFRSVSASWDWLQQTDEELFNLASNSHLHKYCTYLTSKVEMGTALDLLRMKQELESGLFFNSTIPQGYGAGSSGALVAAVYERYTNNNFQYSIPELRSLLAEMEAYFHGSSSGIDPISCYLAETVLIEENGDIRCIENPLTDHKNNIRVYLLDTKHTRETTKLMHHFELQLHGYRFFKKLRDQLIPSVNQAIHHLKTGETVSFLKALKTISEFEFTYLEPMVPEEIRDFWMQGLTVGNYLMKLCGAGGGGYLLVFTTEIKPIEEITNKFGMTLLK